MLSLSKIERDKILRKMTFISLLLIDLWLPDIRISYLKYFINFSDNNKVTLFVAGTTNNLQLGRG